MIKNIAMFSVHGYFDYPPGLGATDTGGQVVFVLELSRALGQQGITVDIYTRQFEDRPDITFVDENVRIIRIPAGDNKFIIKEKIFPVLDQLSQNTLEFFKKNNLNYDVLHSHYWDSGYVCMLLKQKTNIPFIHTSHSLGMWKKISMSGDSDEAEKKYNFSTRIKWENEVFKYADLLIDTTFAHKDQYIKYYNISRKKIHIIPCGVDINRFKSLNPGEKDIEIEVKKPYIFCLSRIDTNKGLDYIIHAHSMVLKKKNCYLIIGGGSKNPQDTELKVRTMIDSLIEKFGTKDWVIQTGYIPDEEVPSYYRQAEVFVLPSKYEPFGMTALEAMACGTPAIITKLGGLKEYIQNEKHAILVDPSNIEELSDAILRILNDNDFRTKIKNQGHNYVINEFSWPNIAKKYINYYNLAIRK